MDPAGEATLSRGSTRIERLDFTRRSVDAWSDPHGRHRNWPIVYTLNNDRDVYVGESLNAVSRMRQHLDSAEKRGLKSVRIVVDDTFNKSVCLDLESFLIRMFSGDGRFQVLNRNDGVTNAEYFDRPAYQDAFAEIFEQLRASGLFEKRIPEIVNSDLFKLSPFKALNKDQEIVVEDIVHGLLADRASGVASTAVVEGGPGTGKTIVAIYLIKLLVDIQNGNDHDNPDAESVFSEFFESDRRDLLESARIGLVVPQQSLRASIKKVFARTPGLHKSMVLTPYDVANSEQDYDLLVVDETHRLTQYGAQAMGTLTKAYRETSQRLASPSEDWEGLTQIDWIVRRSRHQVFLLDEGQGVRPIDVPTLALQGLRASAGDRKYPLMTQMRVRAGDDYIGYVREVLSNYAPEAPRSFAGYDLRFFDDLGSMRDEILMRNREHGLARLAAGYAWPWNSKGSRPDDDVFDMEIDGNRLCWNREATDWVNSRTSVDEVGSIHTVQGYDLNYVGVIIGRDIYFDPKSQRIRFDRANYFDKKGRANNNLRGLTYSDDDILGMVKNIYSVLLTRGMLGTYVYVCDEALREHLRPFFSAGAADSARRV
ncbi:DNA/RNA helicase domain-containing protein [Demequina silvatica]|uniref:DNA/RNA helicase domain-containing protein n=1 Tax=Demequina silvatica TaxID=1638988 RepID=UPI0009E4E48E|nr:DNA/RNA helicase domain-containing protein [Demequina silvatica]